MAGDRLVAFIFALNTLGCVAIALMTVFKRMKALPVDRAPPTAVAQEVDRIVDFVPEFGRRVAARGSQASARCRPVPVPSTSMGIIVLPRPNPHVSYGSIATKLRGFA